MPSLAVVIPTFNRAHLIRRAIDSVRFQLQESDEMIVVDDGSTDNTKEIVQGVRDERIRYIWQFKAGVGAARNRGVAEARGDLIAFQDSDDEWLPGKAALQRQFLSDHPAVLFCFTDLGRDYQGLRHPLLRHGLWHQDLRDWDQILAPPLRYNGFDVYIGDLYPGLMYHNYFSIVCTMIWRKKAGDAIHFAENVATFEECECFGRLAARGSGAFIDCVGARQHYHAGPRITDADWVARAESRLTILKTVWGSDPAFLARHGDQYRELVHQTRLAKVRGLIVQGRPREARAELRSLPGAPIHYRAASRVPASVIAPVVALRRFMSNLGTPSERPRVQA